MEAGEQPRSETEDRTDQACSESFDFEQASGRFKPYHVVWIWLFLAWMFCYIDRSITGPVVSWMIDNEIGFMQNAPMPHALGGVIGGMFFAGYMLTQFPAGYLGDRYGRKVMIVISTAWASVTTFLSGLTRSLNTFVAMRVLTGLGEGAYYSNDRALVSVVTPESKKGLGMGVVFVGLALGLTLATVVTPYMIDFAARTWGSESAWSFPFLVFSIPTMLVAVGVWKFVRRPTGDRQEYLPALARLSVYSVVFLAIIMATYLVTVTAGLDSLSQAVAVVAIAIALIAIIYRSLGKKSAKVLKDRDLLLMYVSAIPILYTLWFFGFWALLVVSEASKMGISGAAIYVGFFGVANGIGYPLGGKICDRAVKSGFGRKKAYVLMCVLDSLAVAALAVYVGTGGSDVLILGILVFCIGVPFAAMQTVHMTLTSDLAPKGQAAQTFGMWNLVGEIGAVISPVLSGTLRDLTGGWTLAIGLDAILLVASAGLVLGIRRQGRRIS
ncbi:MAG: MFS transporter [Methanomassiliicoccales archaeon]|nr:MFS transporter [Methanomassiliicoccales archaeon]